MGESMPEHCLLRVGLTVFIIAAPLIASAQPVAPPPPAQAAAPAAQPDYRPSISDLMNIGVQPRHIKIGLALREQNWGYLTYEANELRGAFTRIARTAPRIDNKFDTADMIESMIGQPLRDLVDAFKAKDAAKSMAAYAAVTSACTACHKAVSHGVIVIKPPQGDSYIDQDFSPPPAQ
jgi:hypothetical protein